MREGGPGFGRADQIAIMKSAPERMEAYFSRLLADAEIQAAARRQHVIASPAYRKALQAAHKKLKEASHEALHPRPR